MAVKLGHKALAEAHDLSVGLAFRVEIGAALAAAHGERGQGVFQNLLKAEKFYNGEIDGGMEAQTALVGAYSGIVLHSEAAVDAGHALIVHPGDAELNNALRLDKALDKPGLFPFGVLVDNKLERLENLAHSLQKLRLMCVAALDVCIYSL